MARITCIDTGRTADCADGSPLMSVCDAAGLDIPFVCRIGTCRSCLIRVVSGGAQQSPRTDRENKLLAELPDCRLGCQMEVRGEMEYSRHEMLTPRQ